MTELHQTLHNDAGICLWTLIAALAMLVIIVVLIVHTIRQGGRRAHNNKKIKDYNKNVEKLFDNNN